MSRDLRFRCWNTVAKKMHQLQRMNFINGQLLYVGSNLPTPKEYKDRYIVMQYTGLRDNSGNDIYEGDIVKSLNDVVQGIVIYQAPRFIIKRNIKNKSWTEFILSAKENQYQTVIGNIYENPELLK